MKKLVFGGICLVLFGLLGCRFVSPDYDHNGVMDNKEIMYPTTNLAHMIDYYISSSFEESAWVVENAIDTQNVMDMDWVFASRTHFNLDISYWDTSNVRDMEGMFSNTWRFNQDISGWKTDKVVNMNYMFSEATAFNQDISTWNISNVKYMDYMFKGAVNFEQDLNGWDVTGKSTEGMFEGSAMETQTHWHPTGCACGQQHEEL